MKIYRSKKVETEKNQTSDIEKLIINDLNLKDKMNQLINSIQIVKLCPNGENELIRILFEGLGKKVYFPREILPLSVVTSGLINFSISCIIILIFVLFSGLGLSWHLVFLPFIVLIQYIISLTFIFLLSAINVYVKDVEYIVNFCLSMAFYATPILYSVEMFEGSPFSFIFKINPLAHIIAAYRDVFYIHQIPNLKNLGILLVVGIILLIICYNIFKKLEKRFAEEI